MKAARVTVIDKIFEEHICLPGYPQVVVTRGWAYRWFRDAVGLDTRQRGRGSLDSIVHCAPRTRLPLTDLSNYDCRLAQIAELMKRDLA